MTDPVDPSTPEREAREAMCDDASSTGGIDGPIIRALIIERVTHNDKCGSHDPQMVALCCEWHACDCGISRALDALANIESRARVAPLMLDAYAAAVRARALADVAGWVDDVRGTMPGIGKRPDEVSNDAFYETRGMERACHALLAKLREAK